MAKAQIRSILSLNLRKFRGRREWSQMDLAEQADISTNFESEIERGLKWPSPETLQSLAEALGVEVFELFGPEDGSSPSIGEYMKRFSNDVFIAVQESVKRSLQSVQAQYDNELC